MISTQMINHEQNTNNRATSGIGKATAEILAKNNYKIILCGRRRMMNLKRTFKTDRSTYLYF
jgi:NADP-dependent 3-hydroxy acid dehydrogenase YdfG